jgi:putative membrane protein
MRAGLGAARRSARARFSPLTRRATMMGIEWMKPGIIVGSIMFALIGVAIFWICFVIVDKITPYDLWAEIVEKKNVALAIVVGSMCIAIGMIVAAAVHG